MGGFLSGLVSLIPGSGTITDIGAALIAFFATITDYRLWRSLGWLLLGGVAMAVGAVLWVKSEVL